MKNNNKLEDAIAAMTMYIFQASDAHNVRSIKELMAVPAFRKDKNYNVIKMFLDRYPDAIQLIELGFAANK